MASNLPAGAVGMCYPQTWVARRIAKHEGVPYGHSVISLGNGLVLEASWPRVKIRTEPPDTDWWFPTFPVDARALRSAAYLADKRIYYDWIEIVRRALPLIFGMPSGRSKGLYCSELVAEMLLLSADYDISGNMEPWSIGVRDLLLLLRSRVKDWERTPQ